MATGLAYLHELQIVHFDLKVRFLQCLLGADVMRLAAAPLEKCISFRKSVQAASSLFSLCFLPSSDFTWALQLVRYVSARLTVFSDWSLHPHQEIERRHRGRDEEHRPHDARGQEAGGQVHHLRGQEARKGAVGF